MSENMISEETAKEQVEQLFDYFEVDTEDEDGERSKRQDHMIKAILKNRLQIEFNADGDPEITQHFKKPVDGQGSLKWDWSRLGVAKREITYKEGGVQPYKQYQDMAARMFKIDKSKMLTLHPIDNSLVEVIGSFFSSI